MKQLYLTTPGNARRNLAAITARPGPCYYLAASYSAFFDLRRLSRNKIENMAGLFQDVFHRHKAAFIDSLARLNCRQDSFAWWGSCVASKSTTASPLAQNATYLLCVQALLQSGPARELTIIVESPALAAGIRNLAAERGYRVSSDLGWYWKISRQVRSRFINTAYLLWFIIRSLCDRLVSVRYVRSIDRGSKPRRRVVIRSWFMGRNFDSHGRYIDRNFGDLPGWLARKNVEVLFLPMFYGHALL